MSDTIKVPRIAASIGHGTVVVNVGTVDGLSESRWLYMPPESTHDITDPVTGEILGTIPLDDPYYVYLSEIHDRFSVGSVWNVPNLCGGFACMLMGVVATGRILSYEMPDGVVAGMRSGCL
jgi:uncharacterized iron-regulated membrane protein